MKYIFIAIVVFVLISIVKFLLRKIFKVKKVKRNFFSYNHINESHRKVDKWMRLINALTLMILSILVINDKIMIYLYLIGISMLLALDYAVRAFFEWKYSEYPKQAFLTIAEMTLMLSAILTFQFWIT
ncbi:DUF4181 domain-containing protein [Rossellomorea aquimaris]|uniref:DUF4181 domain-containing protein n=1 Tax=Rossellomorea aquimaris TaxID=189382 RepID=UPI001CD56107|nr:DUF4181 domain-containing protein [Rossellomorea aquimaris]MCA1057666.1 DUF4181 domain-containing protein [Rossellomorea aquimaris]